MTFLVTKKAHAKMLQHSAKYPTLDISGIMIGSKLDKIIVDCVPLQHSPLIPTALVQAALSQCSAHFQGDIVGIYHANASTVDKSLHPGVEVVATKIDKELGGGSLMVRIDVGESGPSLIGLEFTNNAWRDCVLK
jgi:hypothetical protein